MKEIETLSSQVVYQNKWMVVREDKIRRPSGLEGIYGKVEKPDFVAIIPLEISEETGLQAKEMRYIGHLYQAYGYSNQGCHVFLASGLQASDQCLDPEEEGLITKRFPLADFENMVVTGAIKDSTTVSAYGLAKLNGLI